MFVYEKKLEYRSGSKIPIPRWQSSSARSTAGRTASWVHPLRYLSQRYAMPYPELSAILTDIGTEAAEVIPGRAEPLQIRTKKSRHCSFFFVKSQKTVKG